jgi:hypothetical protein
VSTDERLYRLLGAFLVCWTLAFAPHAGRIPRLAGEWVAYMMRILAYLGIMLFVMWGAD